MVIRKATIKSRQKALYCAPKEIHPVSAQPDAASSERTVGCKHTNI